MTFPEPLLRVWNINRRNALPAWPHRRRSRRRHGRHTAPKKEERKRESERKNLTNHKQICSVCMRMCVLCEPHEQPQSSWPLRSVSKFCIWILGTIFRCATNFTCFYHLLICCSISLFHSLSVSFSLQTFEISQIVTTTKCSPKKLVNISCVLQAAFNQSTKENIIIISFILKTRSCYSEKT